jgi:hypothetical protein
MTATFRVTSIEYVEGQTNVVLQMGSVGSGDVAMGDSATLRLVGYVPFDVRPGKLVKVTVEAVEEPTP